MGTIDTINSADGVSTVEYTQISEAGWGGIRKVVARANATVECWLYRRKSRIALSRLSDRELADIGISRAQADFEAARPFYDGGFDYQ